MIDFSCVCGQPVQAPPGAAGRKLSCPHCRTELTIPAPVRVSLPERDDAPRKSGPWNPWVLGTAILAVGLLGFGVLLRTRGSEPADSSRDQDELRNELDRLAREVNLRKAKAASDEMAILQGTIEGLEGERDALRKDLEQFRAVHEQLKEELRLAKETAPPAPVEAKKADSKPIVTRAMADLAAQCAPSTVIVKTDGGSGVGFIVTPEGLVVTPNHVVVKTAQLTVTVTEGAGLNQTEREYEARVVGLDLVNDLALLKLSIDEGVVPALQLEESGAVWAGDEVFVIGKPGKGSLEAAGSVSKGTVLSLERAIGGTNHLETTVPITVGAGGGPLLNGKGRVVGVVRAKEVNGETVAFALPSSAVIALLDRRAGGFAMPNPLREGEVPRGTQFAHDSSRGIAVDSPISKIVIDPTRDRILCLDPARNGVAVVSLSQRKLLKVITTGMGPVDMVMTGNPDIAWVSHGAAKVVARIHVGEGKILERFEIPRHSSFILTSSHAWTWGLSNMVASRKDAAWHESGMNWLGLAYDSRRDRVLGLISSSRGLAIVEFNPDKLAPVLMDMSKLRAGKKASSTLEELQAEVGELIKIHPLPSEAGDTLRETTLPTFVFNGSTRICVNRWVLRTDKLDTVEGAVRIVPHSQQADTAIGLVLQQVPMADRIRAASPNSKWIATATHIHNGETFAVHKELPVPSPAMAFTPDSKVLYLYDPLNRALLPVDVEGN